MRAERGFTLLEVMIALAVFALLAAAVLSASQFVLQRSGDAQSRLFASWIADNRLTELRLQPPEPGQQRLQQLFAGQSWTVEQRVEREGAGRRLKIDLAVLEGADKTAVYRISGWVEGAAQP
ncbi:type II secretion system minor pseudopilin GspI [Pseudomonas sp. NPDC090202]|uniref:type II secretion system minor pseudopilin GspI n=1 Tax=unclassified Pseudomonas TaxID=196821 RepID=UPI00382F1942